MTTFDPHAAIKKLAEVVLSDGSVPFVRLRVKCRAIGRFYASHSLDFGPEGRLCTDCRGRGWEPEPDVERACWRISKQFEGAELMVWTGRAGVPGKTKEETVLRAALAWVKEQKP